MTDAMLAVRAVRHVYGTGPAEHVAIERLDFTIAAGELVSIVGPSGAGKTTLLRILSGLMPSTEGSIELDGAPVIGVPDGMAMVFQDYGRSLLPWLTVEKNVAFPLTTAHGDVAERRRRVTEALNAVGLADFGRRLPSQLSGGMQQRVAIARALAYRPRLLLMDEPFASLDAQTRSDLEDLVLRIRRDYGVTIVFVTHDIDESVYLADRVLVLSSAPARLVEDLAVPLPDPRDQISTKETDLFVHLRGRVARLIRGGTPDTVTEMRTA
ncbi:ABC transporter ATP-binding protein [Okibacterium endophyticum]